MRAARFHKSRRSPRGRAHLPARRRVIARYCPFWCAPAAALRRAGSRFSCRCARPSSAASSRCRKRLGPVQSRQPIPSRAARSAGLRCAGARGNGQAKGTQTQSSTALPSSSQATCEPAHFFGSRSYRRVHVERVVRADVIVLSEPTMDDDLGLRGRGEPLCIENFPA